jgi:hypothetical protein
VGQVRIRVSNADDAPKLADLYGTGEELDWHDASPYIVVVEEEGKLLGSVQVATARPAGWINMLKIDESIGHRKRAKVTSLLISAALKSIKAVGAQYVGFTVGFKHKEFKKLLKKHYGATVVGQANMMMLRF